MLQKPDFNGINKSGHSSFQELVLNNAIISATSGFGTASLLTSFPLKGKTAFKFIKLEDELVARKLCENIKQSQKSEISSRSRIVSNLSLLLTEGVPYRVYRFDISSLYESFDHIDIINKIDTNRKISHHDKVLLNALFSKQSHLGGQGLPRGLSVSAALSDFLMLDFDKGVQSLNEVFHYSRYVDDIIIITSHREHSGNFGREITRLLPGTLKLNPSKRQIASIEKGVTPAANPSSQNICQFDYLGYNFQVYEPKKDNKKKLGEQHRKVIIDICSKKIRKIKTRISRSFIDYSKTGDFRLLIDRLKFLSMNFSVYNAKAMRLKLAGIYYTYPLISEEALGLSDLDKYLRNLILSKNCRILSSSPFRLNRIQKQILLTLSFAQGHKQKKFIHFPSTRIHEIESCWMY
jgi:hypothetical protein